MTTLEIRHRTSYRYDRPIRLGPHRLMLRPREGRTLRVLRSELRIEPAAAVAWSDDVAGNAVAVATFEGESDALVIECASLVEQLAEAWPVFPIAASAASYPFRYSDEDWADLGALANPCCADPGARLYDWTRGFVRSNPTDTLSLLKDLSAGVSGWVRYVVREDEGTQTPVETLDKGEGSCRDFAMLFAEAVRGLGLGARVVSGYLHGAETSAAADAGTTHAWAEVYLPGAGWITFDPTHRSMGSAGLVAVAVGRDMRRIMPVAGHYVASDAARPVMTVEVTTRAVGGG